MAKYRVVSRFQRDPKERIFNEGEEISLTKDEAEVLGNRVAKIGAGDDDDEQEIPQTTEPGSAVTSASTLPPGPSQSTENMASDGTAQGMTAKGTPSEPSEVDQKVAASQSEPVNPKDAKK